MLKYPPIDDVLRALAEPTRRAIVERLSEGAASVSELARPFDMTLCAVVQHLRVLEDSGVVRSEKVGRARICHLDPAGIEAVADWAGNRRSAMEGTRPARGAWEREDKGKQAMTETIMTYGATPAAESVSGMQGAFSLERSYPVPPERVFAAFSDEAVKRRWFVEGPGWAVYEFTLDFRMGGGEFSRFSHRGGPEIRNLTHFHVIVPDRLIVLTYNMTMAHTPVSVSVASVELAPEGAAGTRLTYSEQGVYFEGAEAAGRRREGTRWLLDRLAEELAR